MIYLAWTPSWWEPLQDSLFLRDPEQFFHPRQWTLHQNFAYRRGAIFWIWTKGGKTTNGYCAATNGYKLLGPKHSNMIRILCCSHLSLIRWCHHQAEPERRAGPLRQFEHSNDIPMDWQHLSYREVPNSVQTSLMTCSLPNLHLSLVVFQATFEQMDV